jgi:hypothetical protein
MLSRLILALMLILTATTAVYGLNKEAALANCSVSIVFNVTGARDRITGLSIYESPQERARGLAPWLLATATIAAGFTAIKMRKRRHSEHHTL